MRHPARCALAACALALLLPVRAAAGAVRSRDPYWFEDSYTGAASVDLAATTADLDTAGTGTVRLPYAPAELAFDPAGSYALAATEGGVAAQVFDGRGVRPVPDWDLGAVDATGVAWLDAGRAVAVSTPSQVAVYGIDPGGRLVLGARAALAGALGLAPGPSALPSAVLAATAGGAQLLEASGAALVPVSGGPRTGPGNRGVAATADGAVAATWQPEAVQLWVWSGAGYRRARAWDPPVPPAADGPVAGVAFFAQGGGYWVLTRQGQLLGYAIGTQGVTLLAGLSASVPALPAPPVAVAGGAGPGAVGVLYPWGWVYEDVGGGGVLRADGARSLAGQRWAVYRPSASLQSVVLPADHGVRLLRVEDAGCARGAAPPDCASPALLPPHTAARYAVSTDGCHSWSPAPTFTNVAVPAGDALCYRLTLTTTDPTVTPVVDVTDLYEIAPRVRAAAVPALLCVAGTC